MEVICPIFENGTYWQHSENVLLAALADEVRDGMMHQEREKSASQ